MPAAPLSAQQLDEIRVTVIELTEKCGLDGWRINDVVAATGVSSRTLYKYFPSKEHLFFNSLLETSPLALPQVLDLAMHGARTPKTRVRLLLQQCTVGMVAQPELSRAMVRVITCGQPWIAKMLMDFNDALQDSIAYLIAGGPPAERHREVAQILEMVWVTSIIAWTTGLRECDFIDHSIDQALKVLAFPA